MARAGKNSAPLTGTGPPISTFRPLDAAVEGGYSAVGLDMLRPSYYENAEAAHAFLPATCSGFPIPEDLSVTAPEIVELVMHAPAVDPSLAFDEFSRGFAAAAYAVDPPVRTVISKLLETAAEHASEHLVLPPLNATLAKEMAAAEAVIFSNGEPSSWRALLAFAQGAFWLLGMLDDAGGRCKRSPRELVTDMVMYFSQLGYTPR